MTQTGKKKKVKVFGISELAELSAFPLSRSCGTRSSAWKSGRSSWPISPTGCWTIRIGCGSPTIACASKPNSTNACWPMRNPSARPAPCKAHSDTPFLLDAAAAIPHFLNGGVAGEQVVRRLIEVTKGAAPGAVHRVIPASYATALVAESAVSTVDRRIASSPAIVDPE
jgi:hypothetical protein